MRKSALLVTSCVVALAFVSSGCRTRHPSTSTDGSGGGVIESPIDPTGGHGAPGTKIDVNLACVNFAFDSFLVGPSEMPKVHAAADYMKSHPGVTCEVDGNSDERGTREYNMALGQSRADAVRAALIGCGVPAEQVESKSFGEEKPFSPDHDEAAWALNRRGEFTMYSH